MLERYKFEYSFINYKGIVEYDYIWVHAHSEEEARAILKRMCTDPTATFEFMYTVDTP